MTGVLTVVAAAPAPSPVATTNFFFSPGFGGLAALVAAVLAFGGIWYRTHKDQKMAQERLTLDRVLATAKIGADVRAARLSEDGDRWWSLAMWLYQEQGLGQRARVTLLRQLLSLATTEPQRLLLRGIREAILPPGSKKGES